MLRLIDVDAGVALKVPSALDRQLLFVHPVVERDGFFAFQRNVSTALLGADLAGPGVFVENAAWPVPAHEPDHVWLRVYRDGALAREIDRRGTVLREVRCPPGWQVVGETSAALVVRSDEYGVGIWRPGEDAVPLVNKARLLAVIPPGRVLTVSQDGIRLIDAESATVLMHVEMSVQHWLTVRAGISHDGTAIAFDNPQSVYALDDRLVYLDLTRGTASYVAGGFDRSGWEPVFARSGRHVFVGVPSESRVTAFSVDALELTELRLKGGNPMPLLDLGRMPAVLT